MKRRDKILSVAAAVTVAGAAALISGGQMLYSLALDARQDREWIFKAPHNVIPEDGRRDLRYKTEAFVTAHPPASRYLTSRDGLRLHALAWENPAAPRSWVIVLHGYTGRAEKMADEAMALYKAGYSVLCPDCRGHGQSAGRYIGMGWHDRLDLIDWARSLAAAHPAGDIALYGISMGAAAVMMAAGEPLPPQVYALVEDCGYTGAWDELSYQLKALFGLQPFPLMYAASGLARLRAGYFLRDCDAVKQLSKATLPMLFIHGEADTFVPATMLDACYTACASAVKEKILVAGAGHGRAASVMGEAYWLAVAGFLKRNQRR